MKLKDIFARDGEGKSGIAKAAAGFGNDASSDLHEYSVSLGDAWRNNASTAVIMTMIAPVLAPASAVAAGVVGAHVALKDHGEDLQRSAAAPPPRP